MWDSPPHRLALLELWATGELRLRESQRDASEELRRLGWARRTGRRDVLAVDPAHRAKLSHLLDRCWSGWQGALKRLEAADLKPNERGWAELARRDREASPAASLPTRVNQRTASAALATHSKATLGKSHLDTLGDREVTRDGLVRLRPSKGLTVERGGVSHDAIELAGFLGELAITERAIRDGTTLGGALPQAILLVENVGAYVDVAAPEGWLVAHVPGWDTGTARLLLERLPDVFTVLFGDLDPNGVRIQKHLRRLRPDLAWAIPAFWEEHVGLRALPGNWPDDMDLEAAPPLVRKLAHDGVWLEQEVIAVDPRFPGYLEELWRCRK